MRSQYQRVNGRGHKTISNKAQCSECKRTYTAWKFIAKDGKCFQCHGIDESNTQALIKFIQENS